MNVAANELRPGVLVRHEGRMCSVLWWNILRNDRRAFVQMRIKDLQTGRVQELKEHTDSKWEVLDKEEKDLSHSYRDGQVEVFFTESGDEVRCPIAAAEEALAMFGRRVHLVIPQGFHTNSPSRCVSELIGAFLEDPAAGATDHACAAKITRPRFLLSPTL